MRRNVTYGVLLVLLAVSFGGCATFNAIVEQRELTPAARYYDALKTFNSNVETYLQVYDLSDPETKAKWKANIDPIIRVANTALNTWKQQLNSPTSSTAEADWREARKQMVNILIASGIIKIQE